MLPPKKQNPMFRETWGSSTVRALHDAALAGIAAGAVPRYCAAGALAGSVGIAGAIGAPLAAGAVVAPVDADAGVAGAAAGAADTAGTADAAGTAEAAAALAGIALSAPGSSY
ncbi:MAG: hypothetical protein IH603_06625, partial [Burkholderia vietnamiensis]|nr:hypothetical protein [Burkholderia vietnamiensis]